MPIGHQQGIGGLHHDQIRHPQQGNILPSSAEDDVVVGVDLHQGLVGRVARSVLGQILAHADPRAHVIPVKTGLDIEHPARFFHQGVVDGDLRKRGKLGLNGRLEVLAVANLRDKMRQFWPVAAQLRHHRRNAPNEHPGVPRKIPLPQEILRQVRIRLFPKPLHFVNRGVLSPSHLGAGPALNVAVTWTSPRRADPDRDQGLRLMGHGDGCGHARAKGGLFLNQLVCGKHQHHRVGIARRYPADAQGNRWSRVALGRFGQDVLRRKGLPQKGADRRLLFSVGQNENIFPRHQPL